MLPRAQRIPKTAFPLPRKVVRAETPYGSLAYYPLPEKGLRAAVVVAAKILKRSVDRHTAKRRIYDVFATLFPTLSLSGYLVFYVKGQTIPSRREYEEAIERAIKILETCKV